MFRQILDTKMNKAENDMNQLKEIQKLSIELFFNDELSDSFSKDPKEVLKNRGINDSNLRFFSNVLCEAFNVESQGRRFLIAKEISKRYKVFFEKYLNQKEINNISLVSNSEIMNNYFKSDYFLYKKVSFPHYTGAGSGIENSSKFFFFAIQFLKNKGSTNGESVDNLLVELFSAFAIHIHHHSKFSDVDVYNSTQKGIYFQIAEQAYLIHQNMRIKLDERSLSSIKLKYISLNSIIEQYTKCEVI